jgi:hypothetical protein
MIAAEILEFGPIFEVMESGICRYLEDHGYLLFSRFHLTSIFIDAANYTAVRPLRRSPTKA